MLGAGPCLTSSGSQFPHPSLFCKRIDTAVFRCLIFVFSLIVAVMALLLYVIFVHVPIDRSLNSWSVIVVGSAFINMENLALNPALLVRTMMPLLGLL